MEAINKKRYYINGQINYDESFLNGEYHGIQKWYYDNGQLEHHINAMEGMAVGMWKIYNRNATRDSISNFKNDVNNGPQIIFNYGS